MAVELVDVHVRRRTAHGSCRIPARRVVGELVGRDGIDIQQQPKQALRRFAGNQPQFRKNQHMCHIRHVQPCVRQQRIGHPPGESCLGQAGGRRFARNPSPANTLSGSGITASFPRHARSASPGPPWRPRPCARRRRSLQACPDHGDQRGKCLGGETRSSSSPSTSAAGRAASALGSEAVPYPCPRASLASTRRGYVGGHPSSSAHSHARRRTRWRHSARGRLTDDPSTRQGTACARLSVITQVGLASTSPEHLLARFSGEKGAAGSFDSTSAITVNRRATVEISRRFSASSIPAAPFGTSTYRNLISEHQARYSSTRPCSHSASTSVPPAQAWTPC